MRSVILVLSFLGVSFSGGNPDLRFIDRANSDSNLIVLITGLYGVKTWPAFTEFIKGDTTLNGFDILIYESPIRLTIPENAGRLQGLIKNAAPGRRKFYIAHSLGGFIAKSIYMKYGDKSSGIATIGTPSGRALIQTKWYQDAAFHTFKPFFSRLTKEAYNRELLAEINSEWKRFSPGIDPKLQAYLFGNRDGLILFDSEDPNSVMVDGDHTSMLKGELGRKTFGVLREKLLAFERGG
ncbi:MAG TPA: hypothetical protein VJ385_14060 [Fibrobacteria bacterium]|nr:hypothetical protein [Fibrobacteria bacterium]